jgi:hypothetical protein
LLLSEDTEIEVIVFQAADGDCMLFRGTGPSPFRILVDGGRGAVADSIKAFLHALPNDERTIDLFIITHIDADHISGALEILHDDELNGLIQEVWFNYPGHPVRGEPVELSVAQGNEMVKLLLSKNKQWNSSFKKHAITRSSTLPNVHQLKSNVKIEIVGPADGAFKTLAKVWNKFEPVQRKDVEVPLPQGIVALGGDSNVNVEAMAAEEYKPDTSVINASSICFVIEYGPLRALISSDSNSESLLLALKDQYGTLPKFSFATIPHHGSARNVSREFGEKIQAEAWAISTNGSGHKHPNSASIARLLLGLKGRGDATVLLFNHRHFQTDMWDNTDLMNEYQYKTLYPTTVDRWIKWTIQAPTTAL